MMGALRYVLVAFLIAASPGVAFGQEQFIDWPTAVCRDGCEGHQTIPWGGTLPTNGRMLFDSQVFDQDTLTARTMNAENRVLNLQLEVDPSSATTGMYVVFIAPEDQPPPGEPFCMTAWRRSQPGSGVGGCFDYSTESDETPPVAEGIRLDFEHTFENDCGSKAVHVAAETAYDSQSPTGLPLLVTLFDGVRMYQSWTSVRRFGPAFFFDAVLHAGNYIQSCIVEGMGIETLDLRGEVTVTFELFDAAGNAAEPITQVVQWPPELGPEPDGGMGGGAGGGAGGTSGAGGDGSGGSGPQPGSGGCSVSGRSPWRGTWILLALIVLLRTRERVRSC